MKFADSRWIKGLLTFRPEPEQQARRIVKMQLHVVLPAKAGIIAVILYYVFSSGWSQESISEHDIALDFLRKYFLVYSACNLGIGICFLPWRHFAPGIFQWLVFTLGLLDGLFVSGLVLMTDGFASIAYWLFPALIILNAVTIPLATPQIVLNLLLGVFYVSAGLLYPKVPLREYQTPPASIFLHRTNLLSSVPHTNHLTRTNLPPIKAANLPSEPSKEEEQRARAVSKPDATKIILLYLLTASCYGVQVLRRTIEETREFAVREGQLRSAGRLSAEFAHQIKNPLAIINNAVYSLQRAVKEGRADISPQLEIIREEVERSDKIITRIMGYAQLSDGHVEKLDLVDELNHAIDQTFPPAVETGVAIERHYAPHCPPLLMQRQHLSQILVNILQNAREALNGKGKVSVTFTCRGNQSVQIVISDSGPGISPDKVEKVFEQYYSTKERGTGLGLAIVRHNVELYAGKVRVESELGKGARFILNFPAKAVMNWRNEFEG